MKLTGLRVTEKTSSHTFFTMTIERESFWSDKKSTELIECFRTKYSSQSRFLDTGDTIYMTFPHLDDSISAILSTDNQRYVKEL